MSQPAKKLTLTRETVKSLNVKAGLRTGDGASLVAQGGASGRGPGSGPRGSDTAGGVAATIGCGLGGAGFGGAGGGLFGGGVGGLGGSGH